MINVILYVNVVNVSSFQFGNFPFTDTFSYQPLISRKAESGHSQVVDASIRDEHGWTALHVAAYCGLETPIKPSLYEPTFNYRQT